MSQQYPPPPPGAADAAPGPRPSRVLRWAVASAALGALMIYNSVDSSGTGLPGPPASAAAAPSITAGAPATAIGPVGVATPTVGLPHANPTRLVIKNIAVDAPFTPLHLDAAGNLEAPPAGNTNLVGWYAEGPTPGERGPAIVAGHVDTKTGPAVFLLLRLLRPGATADITRADGTVATFTVDSVEMFSKGEFPDQRVYGATPDPQLRIITCGGSYDRSKRDYTDNVVVFAHLTSSRRA
ncbi:class F sortase [Actinacidiphila paucisporea]|uniref:Sortase family protein n=1 Tax=Actinacidiphila paucisporea TaxID=310782 RepID=A0A1M7GUW2_9ACTN|nr:class F sortase [Actinacidiphila paucisporea]SHM19629.1 Sortase family protein [Actinacidiphila paucisporea]